VDIRAGQTPVWDMEVRYPIMKSTKSKHRKLEVACYSDEPRPLPDQLLGKAVVDLSDTLKSGEFDGELLILSSSRGRLMTLIQNGSISMWTVSSVERFI